MSKPRTKADNQFLADKVAMRILHLPKKKELSVLNLYHGTGLVWNTVVARTKRQINVVGIDKESNSKEFSLRGDNTKFLDSIDLGQFDIVDLDAYGVPYAQLCKVLDRRTPGQILFITFVQSNKGTPPFKFLSDIGFPKAMVKKCPALFVKNGFEMLKEWLCSHGIRTIWVRSHVRGVSKFYVCCKL